MTKITFGEAVNEARSGKRICRDGWNGKGMWIEHIPAGTIKLPSGFEAESEPPLVMKAVSGRVFFWNPNQLDMLSSDWIVLAQKDRAGEE